MKSIEKINQELLVRAAGRRSASVPGSPEFIQVEVSNICNLSCIMCPLDALKAPKKKLSLADFERIIEQFPFLNLIGLYGIGEPLNNPHLKEMIQRCKSEKIETELVTNATLLNEERGRSLLESGLGRLYLSVDSVRPEKYAAIRKGAEFEKVRANMENFIRHKRATQATAPKIGVATVVMRENIRELPEIIRFAEQMGADSLLIKGLNTAYTEKFLEAEENSDETAKLIALCNEVNQQGKLRVTFYQNNQKACSWPWTRAFITANGEVTPCCNCPDPDQISFGNLFQQSFQDIWNNSKYRAFRAAFSKGIPPVCRSCPDYSFDYLQTGPFAAESRGESLSALRFCSAKTAYKSNEAITLHLEQSSRSAQAAPVDLWVAMQTPGRQLLYFTGENRNLFQFQPRPFKKFVQWSRQKNMPLFTLPQLPPNFKPGEYTFYALCCKANAPLTELKNAIRSNIAKLKIVLEGGVILRTGKN